MIDNAGPTIDEFAPSLPVPLLLAFPAPPAPTVIVYVPANKFIPASSAAPPPDELPYDVLNPPAPPPPPLADPPDPVSYTHLTLPTICSV